MHGSWQLRLSAFSDPPAAFCLAVLLSLLAACSSPSADRAGTDNSRTVGTGKDAGSSSTHTDASTPATGSDAGATSSACKGPGYATSGGDTAFVHVSAAVLDADSNPVRKVIAQACGTNICLNGTTDGSGHVAIDANVSMTKPAFKYGGGQLYAKFALPLRGASPIDRDLGKQVTFAFDPPPEGLPFTPGTTATSHGIALSFAGDMLPVSADPFDFDTDDLQKLRAVAIPIDEAPAAVDATLGFEILVAFTPVGAVLCPAAHLTVPNTAQWKAGSAVEFFLHGVDVAEEWAPYGGWAKVSDGSVSSDGKTVETAADGGLPALSVVGIRLAG